MAQPKSYTHRAYARVGIMGNPSDGFFGKTIAMTISNFWAEATIMHSDRLHLVPHAVHDPNSFGSLQVLGMGVDKVYRCVGIEQIAVAIRVLRSEFFGNFIPQRALQALKKANLAETITGCASSNMPPPPPCREVECSG